MRDNQRASIAFIVGSLTNDSNSMTVYDYSQSEHSTFGGFVKSNLVDLYDYEQGCYVAGRGNNGVFSLYHYGNGDHIDLIIDGNKFTGFDYNTASYFKGAIKNGSVSLFDYEVGNDYNYGTE